MKMKAINLLISIIIAYLLVSCDDDNRPGQRIDFPESNVSYLEHVQPFIQINCSYTGCHGTVNPAGGRDMTTYFNLFSGNNTGLIVLNQPEASRLVQIVDTTSLHINGLFPKNYFSNEEHMGLLTWIREGAQNN